MNTDLKSWYTQRYPKLVQLAEGIEADLRNMFNDVLRIDRVYARAKVLDSFMNKASRRKDNGSLVYANPKHDIQDQLGARIVVFYTDDLESAVERARKAYNNIEEQEKRPDYINQFGYQGMHFIVHFPPAMRTIRDELEIDLNFFELQIRTLYQHAWSEASHNLAYKPDSELNHMEKRAIAYTAAQSWGADRIFDQIRNGNFLH